MARRENNLTAGKRLRGSKPYDPNNSFVKKVATKVTDYMPQNSWISKWFNTSEDNGEILNSMNNSDELEGLEEDSGGQQPPPKRPKILMTKSYPPGTFPIHSRNRSAFNKVVEAPKESSTTRPFAYGRNNQPMDDFREPNMAGPSEIRRLVASTPAVQQPDPQNLDRQRSELHTLVSQNNNGGAIANGTDDNSESGESTSGCSSLIPQANNRQEGPYGSSYSSPFNSRKRFLEGKYNYGNHLRSPKSLFGDSSSRESLSSRRPSFNASIVNSNSGDRSPGGLLSPFYSGKTTFGGANAVGLCKQGRNLLGSINGLQASKRMNVRVKPSTSSSTGIDSSGMSQTTKRIFEILEDFSTPITDAKRIPMRGSDSSPLTTSSSGKKRPREETALPRVGLRHLTRELNVPTVPDILKLRRQRLQDTTLAARKLVSASSAPPPTQEYQIRTENEENSKLPGKVKTKSKMEVYEPLTPVNLPSIVLPITTLPSFGDIKFPAYKQQPSSSPGEKTANNKPAAVPPTTKVSDEQEFKFSSPIHREILSKTTKEVKSSFTFSEPLKYREGVTKMDSVDSFAELTTTRKRSVDSAEVTRSESSSNSTPNFNFQFSSSSTMPKPRKSLLVDERAETPSPATTPAKPATKLSSGSVMDVLSCTRGAKDDLEDTEIIELSDSDGEEAAAAAKPKDDLMTNSYVNFAKEISGKKWECNVCYVRNDESDAKCANCKAVKPNEAKSSNNDEKTLKAKNAVVNKNTIIKPAEKTSSPTSLLFTSTTAKSTTSNTFEMNLDKSKPAKDTWVCPCCAISNNSEYVKCMACNASKPGQTLAAAAKKVEEPAMKTTTAFPGFGNEFKAPTGSWSCDVCMVRNESDVTSCAACTTAKPGSKEPPKAATTTAAPPPIATSSFGDKFKKPINSWTCDDCMVTNNTEVTECAACGGVKPGAAKKSSSETTSSNNSSSSSIKFNVSMPAEASSFKFGIDKANNNNEVVAEKPASTAGFVFANNKSTTDSATFSFGIPQSSAFKPANAGFSFGQAAKPAAAADDNKPSESGKDKTTSEPPPKFTFGTPTPSAKAVDEPKREHQTSATSQFTFAAPLANTTGGTTGFTFGASKTNNTVQPEINEADKKKKESAPIFSEPTSFLSTTTPKTQATFSFGAASTPIPSSAADTTSATTTTSGASLPTFSAFSEASKPATTTASPATVAQTTSLFSSPAQSPALFTFGSHKATSEPLKPTSSPLFGGSATPQAATTCATPFTVTPSATPLFGGVSNSSSQVKPSQQSPFGQANSTFGLASAAPDVNRSSPFQKQEEKKPATITFNSSETFRASNNSPAPASTGLFGSSSSSTTAVFGTPSTTPSAFGSPSVSGNNAFGTPKPAEVNATNSGGLFAFGSPAVTATQQKSEPSNGGFNFSAPSAASQMPQKTMFSFGAANSQTASPAAAVAPAPAQSTFGSTFSSPAPVTNAFGFSTQPKAEQLPPPPAYPGDAASGSPFAFRPQAPSAAASFAAPVQQQQQQQPTNNAGFNFNVAPQNPTGGFNFGAMAPATASPSTGFNFNAPQPAAFDPDKPPTFKFTDTSAPPMFNSSPQAASRKVKKAVRRLPPR